MIDTVPSARLRRVVRVLSCLIVAAIGVGLAAEAWELVADPGHPEVAGHADADVVALRDLADRLRELVVRR